MSLTDRVVVVTGAGGGLGSAIGAAFLREGAEVIGVGRTLARLEQTAQDWSEIGSHHRMARLDVSDEGEVEAFFAALPRVDVLVNCAGVVQWGPLLEISAAQFRAVLESNLTGAFLMMRAAAARMLPRAEGLVINVASVAALRGLEKMAAYSASKFALRGLSQAASLELGPRGVRVTTLCPGQIDTPMLGPGDHPGTMPPEHVAEAIVRLASLPPSLHLPEVSLEPHFPLSL